jgi:hypothetical protein
MKFAAFPKAFKNPRFPTALEFPDKESGRLDKDAVTEEIEAWRDGAGVVGIVCVLLSVTTGRGICAMT